MKGQNGFLLTDLGHNAYGASFLLHKNPLLKDVNLVEKYFFTQLCQFFSINKKVSQFALTYILKKSFSYLGHEKIFWSKTVFCPPCNW
jgi:hypothetical protein